MRRIFAVVVAYNRRELLQQTLAALAQQTESLAGIIVIDNASTDDSGAVAGRHEQVSEVITMRENLGGAGGFAAGIARAVHTHKADGVWVMDDDTVPTPNALEALVRARENYPGEPALLASTVVWKDGRNHPMNTPRNRPGAAKYLRAHAASVGARQIRTASFVSILIDARAIYADGLPEADYFLWNDDFEYTARLLRTRVGLAVGDSTVVHLTKKFGASETNPGKRFFNEVRNKVWMFRYSRALRPEEKLLYGGRSVLRWIQTLASAGNRRELAKWALEGWQAGQRPPRPTATVLAGTPVAGDVQAVAGRAGLTVRRNG